MPIFEYVCSDCKHEFEVLVQGSQQAKCPACHGARLEKQLSVFAVSGSSAAAKFDAAPSPCGHCGDARGPGACAMN